MLTTRSLLFAGLLLTLTGCKTDPNKELFPAYYKEASAILSAHAEISDSFKEFNDSADASDPTMAVKKIEAEVLNKLRKLAARASQIDLGSATQLRELHSQLATGLLNKYEGYKELLSAYKESNMDTFSSGKQKIFSGADEISKFEENLNYARRVLGF